MSVGVSGIITEYVRVISVCANVSKTDSKSPMHTHTQTHTQTHTHTHTVSRVIGDCQRRLVSNPNVSTLNSLNPIGDVLYLTLNLN